MDYEKKYNEALERARALWREAIEKEYVIDYLKDYETIFPELRESEDERTRKGIIEIIKAVSGPDCDVYLDEKKQEKYLAWLEKQKEQKELPLMGGDTDSYFDDLRMTTKPLTSREWFDEGMKYAQMLQKEQKPLETPSPSVIYTEQGEVLAEQKPAWSEEDEHQIEVACSFLKDFADKGYENAVCCIDWLKSLRPDTFQNGNSRPKTSDNWKPSEEQMDALNKASRFIPYNCDILKSLYEQLKKL